MDLDKEKKTVKSFVKKHKVAIAGAVTIAIFAIILFSYVNGYVFAPTDATLNE